MVKNKASGARLVFDVFFIKASVSGTLFVEFVFIPLVPKKKQETPPSLYGSPRRFPFLRIAHV